MVSGAAWRQPLVSCAPCNFRLTFRVSSFKPNNVAYITANRLNFYCGGIGFCVSLAFMAIAPQMDLS